MSVKLETIFFLQKEKYQESFRLCFTKSGLRQPGKLQWTPRGTERI